MAYLVKKEGGGGGRDNDLTCNNEQVLADTYQILLKL